MAGKRWVRPEGTNLTLDVDPVTGEATKAGGINAFGLADKIGRQAQARAANRNAASAIDKMQQGIGNGPYKLKKQRRQDQQ
jgi:hypothetical protein